MIASRIVSHAAATKHDNDELKNCRCGAQDSTEKEEDSAHDEKAFDKIRERTVPGSDGDTKRASNSREEKSESRGLETETWPRTN